MHVAISAAIAIGRMPLLVAGSVAGNVVLVAVGWEQAVETAPEGFATLSREVQPEASAWLSIGSHLRGLRLGEAQCRLVVSIVAEHIDGIADFIAGMVAAD